MKIALGSDHAGYELKEALKSYLSEKPIAISDMGTHSTDAVDYPDFGRAVALMVAAGEVDRGILLCGSGIGMSIVANRVPGVRAALCTNEGTARLSRLHNDANVLVLPGRSTDITEAQRILDVWLATDFEGGRHQRRLRKIDIPI